MTLKRHPNRRLWCDGGSVFLQTKGLDGEPIVREFWVPIQGGYVREVDGSSRGLLDRFVCRGLGMLGVTLYATREGLLHVIRREHLRNAMAARRRIKASGPGE